MKIDLFPFPFRRLIRETNDMGQYLLSQAWRRRMLLILFVNASLFFVATSIYAESDRNSNALAEILQDSKEGKRSEIYYIYTLDVFEHFNLGKEYNTDLKKSVFKKTAEYQENLNELKKLKQEIQKQTYYVTIPGDGLKDYDTKKKGFELEVGGNITFGGTSDAKAPKSINGFQFPSMPVKTIPWKSFMGRPMPDGIFTETLFFPIKEEQGLSIENNKEDVNIYFIFNGSFSYQMGNPTLL